MAPNPMSFIQACLPCLPSARKSKLASHRAEYYNAQLRANLGMPERPIRLEAIVDSQPQQQQQPPAEITNSTGGGEATTGGSSRRSAPQPRGRFPTAPNSNDTAAAAANRASNPKTWTNTPMETEQLAEFFGKLETLNHLPYAVCGRGALVDHGLGARKAKQVSIMVPSHSKDVVASWAKSSGWVVQRGKGNGAFVGIPLASDKSLRQLRVKYLDDSQFEPLERVRSRLNDGSAWVLGLTSQLDHLAAAWLDHYKRSEEAATSTSTTTTTTTDNSKNKRKSNSSSTSTSSNSSSNRNAEKPLREIARDILWTLNEMACPASSKGKGKASSSSSSSHKPELHLLPTLRSEDFFVPFTERYAEARTEMARAGIDVGAILAGLRDRRALREHNEMLAQYGVAPLQRSSRDGGADGGEEDDEDEEEREKQRLPFNGLRDLNSRKSVYTLATNLSVSELNFNNSNNNNKSPVAPLTPPPFVKSLPEPAAGAGAIRPRRPRSVRVSEANRPDIPLPPVSLPAVYHPGKKDVGERRSVGGGLRRTESLKPPPRTSMIPHAEPTKKSAEWF